MNRLRPKIIIEDYKNKFDYKKKDTNINIEFNRVSFIFFFFFIIYLIYTIHLIHLGSRKSNTEIKDILPTFDNKLYRADIIDINGNYLAKTVKSIDIGIKTSDIIDKQKLLLSLNIIFPNKDFDRIKNQIGVKALLIDVIGAQSVIGILVVTAVGGLKTKTLIGYLRKNIAYLEGSIPSFGFNFTAPVTFHSPIFLEIVA